MLHLPLVHTIQTVLAACSIAELDELERMVKNARTAKETVGIHLNAEELALARGRRHWMNVYDKVEEVLTALDEVATAIGALTAFNHKDPLPLRAEGKKRLLAFVPGYHTVEKNALEAWETSVAKDGRRAVQLLLRDYQEQKAKVEALLAAELPATTA